MAKVRYRDGRTLTDLQQIQKALKPLSVQVAHWPVTAPAALVDRPALSADEKEAVLRELDGYFERLQAEAGYQSRDLIVLHPQVEGLDGMLAKFDRCHTHDDDEVRYVIDGEGVFGFVLPDGDQLHLTVEAGEYINVPAGAEHWFYLTEKRRIKAVRYFTGTEGWVPHYTQTEVQPLAAAS
ncbi:MAG TPA: cupin domain-containing protein [Myxococcales bacterium LLY-WYZ-16_1]|nr:cupin domain-containing protein [Myxococcales bacterium LLY-WYZ-16_1]